MRISFGGLLAVLSMTISAAALGCAPGDDLDSLSAEEGEGVTETARSRLSGGVARYEVWTLSSTQRVSLSDAEKAYLQDAIVIATDAALDSPELTDSHAGERAARQHFLGIRSRIESMEAFLSGTGAASTLLDGRMPSWETLAGIPKELRGADPHDDGTPREPVLNPNNSVGGASFSCEDTPWFEYESRHATSVIPLWEAGAIRPAFGGVLAGDEAPAAVIYWPLQVDVLQHYEAWEGCHAFPSPAVVDDDLSEWTTAGPGVVSQVDGGVAWSRVFRIVGTSTGTTMFYRDVPISADSAGRTARLLAFTRTSQEMCEGGRAKMRLAFFNGSSLVSMVNGDEGAVNAWTASKLTATIPAGTTKIRMTALVSTRPTGPACTGQYASVDDVRLMVY